MANKKLLTFRKQIDTVDRQLLKALEKRFILTQKVGELKAELHLSVRDLVREETKLAELMEKWPIKNPDSLFIRKLFSMIMAESRKNHKRLRIK